MLQPYKPVQTKTKTIQPYKIPKNNKIQIPPPYPILKFYDKTDKTKK